MCVDHNPLAMLIAKPDLKKTTVISCVHIYIFFLLLGKTQEEGLRRVQELKIELSLLKEATKDEKKRQIELQQEHAALTEELAKEKVTQNSYYMMHSFLKFSVVTQSKF